MESTHPSRGPLLMVISTGSYAVNDTMMKLATEGLPPYETLTLRGIAAVLWGFPLLLLLGYRRHLGMMFEPRVLARNLCETGGILCYIVALANMPIADVVALGQITPLLVILGAAFLLGERVGPLRMTLIGIGFVVFGVLPNALALAGIAVVTASGLAVVMLDGRRRPIPAA